MPWRGPKERVPARPKRPGLALAPLPRHKGTQREH